MGKQRAAAQADPPQPEAPEVDEEPVDDTASLTPEEPEEPELSETAETEEPPEPEEEASEPSEDSPSALQRYDELLGTKKANQFSSDEDWFRSVRELEQTIGRRDEDAQLGRQLRERLGEQGLRSVLGGQPEPTDTAAKLPDFDEFAALGDRVQQGKASEAARERYDTLLREYQRRVYELASGGFSHAIKEELGKYRQEQEQEQAQLRLDGWMDKNRQTLFVKGEREQGFTALGQRANDIYGSDVLEGIKDPVRRSELALKLATGEQRQPSKVRPTSRRAVREPDMATAPGKSLEQRIDEAADKGMGLAALLAMADEAEET